MMGAGDRLVVPIHAIIPRQASPLAARTHRPDAIATRFTVAARLAGERDLRARATLAASGASAAVGRRFCFLCVHCRDGRNCAGVSGRMELCRNSCELASVRKICRDCHPDDIPHYSNASVGVSSCRRGGIGSGGSDLSDQKVRGRLTQKRKKSNRVRVGWKWQRRIRTMRSVGTWSPLMSPSCFTLL